MCLLLPAHALHSLQQVRVHGMPADAHARMPLPCLLATLGATFGSARRSARDLPRAVPASPTARHVPSGQASSTSVSAGHARRRRSTAARYRAMP
eukprot:1957423-Lingulodinium_polyedra.AAC.1